MQRYKGSHVHTVFQNRLAETRSVGSISDVLWGAVIFVGRAQTRPQVLWHVTTLGRLSLLDCFMFFFFVIKILYVQLSAWSAHQILRSQRLKRHKHPTEFSLDLESCYDAQQAILCWPWAVVGFCQKKNDSFWYIHNLHEVLIKYCDPSDLRDTNILQFSLDREHANSFIDFNTSFCISIARCSVGCKTELVWWLGGQGGARIW